MKAAPATRPSKETPTAAMLLDIKREEIEELYTLTQRVVETAAKNNLLIATAESCTGGMISGFITSVDGSSAVFWGGAVTYSNAIKEKFLGVSPVTLHKYGAVSEQTALEMARGIRQATGADIGVAVTGIAGPKGGTPGKPVGLVYIALKGPAEVEHVKQCNFTGSRHRVRFETTRTAIAMLYDIVHRRA
ncbi:MAG: CinA family protein [Candidatus Magnetominusculus sp. LBB02]|nr:CinA family protein [Candidatus Magnetominusculus sp. LBB02]